MNPPTRVSEPFSLATVTSTEPGAWAGVKTTSVEEVRNETEGVRPNQDSRDKVPENHGLFYALKNKSNTYRE